MSDAPSLPLIMVPPIVRCNYFVGAARRERLTTALPWDTLPAE